jgi:hypothetical protein
VYVEHSSSCVCRHGFLRSIRYVFPNDQSTDALAVREHEHVLNLNNLAVDVLNYAVEPHEVTRL